MKYKYAQERSNPLAQLAFPAWAARCNPPAAAEERGASPLPSQTGSAARAEAGAALETQGQEIASIAAHPRWSTDCAAKDANDATKNEWQCSSSSSVSASWSTPKATIYARFCNFKMTLSKMKS